MADAPDKDQKTEEPTAKKLDDARKKGDVPTAPEIKQAAMLLGGYAVVAVLGLHTIQQLSGIAVRLWGSAEDWRMEPQGAQDFLTGLFAAFASGLLPVLAALCAIAIVGGLVQGPPGVSWSRVAPKWNKLNPAAGLGRIFGKRALVEFAKTLVKLLLVGGIGMWVAWPSAATIDRLVGADAYSIAAAAHAMVLAMLWPVLVLTGALALFDLFWQRRNFLERMRMSLQEVKDEHKESEGDPKIKGKIRALQMQRSRSRMMQKLPEASVVITNPTHFAVALKYDHGEMAAPIVIAKGTDAIALKIREIAAQHRIPLVENRPLARALYASAELDRPIPVEHYKAVAEVISYVMRIARDKR